MADDVELLRTERDALLQWENEVVKSESEGMGVEEMKGEIKTVSVQEE